MLNITRRDIDSAKAFARDAMSRVRSASGIGESVVGQLTQTLEVSAGAVGVGILSGRFGPLNIQGTPVPLDLAGGVGLHLLAFMGLAGKYDEHLHNFADGVLAGYLTKFGVGYGKAWAQKAGIAPRTVVGGLPSAFQRNAGFGNRLGQVASAASQAVSQGPAPMSAAELSALTQAVR